MNKRFEQEQTLQDDNEDKEDNDAKEENIVIEKSEEKKQDQSITVGFVLPDEHNIAAFYDIFLPKRVPPTCNRRLFDVCNEFDEYLSMYGDLYGINKEFEYIVDMKGQIDAPLIQKKLEQLRIGNVIGFFLQQQNVSIDFKKIFKDEIVISLYYIAAPLSDIYPKCKQKNKHNNTTTANNDVYGSYTIATVSPIKRVVVPIDSITLLWIQQLYALATNEMDGSLASSIHKNVKKHVNEVANPKYVTEWLIGTLEGVRDLSDAIGQVDETKPADHESLLSCNGVGDTDDEQERSRISGISTVSTTSAVSSNPYDTMVINYKKVRDCAVLTDDGPWRRSGAWFGLKQSLDSHYHNIYKLIIVHFMALYLEKYENCLNAVQKHEAVVKIQRRIKKIQDGYKCSAGNKRDYKSKSNGDDNSETCLQEEILDVCQTIIAKVFKKMDEEWKNRMKSEHTHLEWDRVTGLELLQHEYPSQLLQNELIDIVKNNNNDEKKQEKYDFTQNIKYYDTWRNKERIFAKSSELLHDFENDVFYEGKRLVKMVQDCKEESNLQHMDCSLKMFRNYYQLNHLFRVYARYAPPKYAQRNPYYFSRLLLTSLNVMVIIHIKNNIQFSKDYCFNEYRFPQFIVPLFDFLLLNRKQEVENASLLKSYICKFNKKELMVCQCLFFFVFFCFFLFFLVFSLLFVVPICDYLCFWLCFFWLRETTRTQTQTEKRKKK